MAGSVRNILVGAAAVYISVATKQDGTPAAQIPALGTATAVTALAAASATWRDVGFTTNGVDLSYEPNYGEVPVDQLLDAARLFKQSMKVTVKTEFAEATLENLFVVMNQQTGYSGSADFSGAGTGGTVSQATAGLEIQGGSLGDYPVERSLVAVGQAPRPVSGNAERVYYAARVMSISTSAFGQKRDGATTFPVEFRLLPVSSTSNAYGKIVDRTYT